ncbi:MAG: endonuclease/exonuclease/phosphatase family protein [Gammaproteobacteria bacterium]|nr:endonuclease/exonuclease/phosphatase family protein [Gammaproteobacteria bacterium]
MQPKVTFVGLLQAAAVLTVAFSFVTGFDLPHRNIELFSHFRLQYFVVSILLLVAFAVLRNPLYVSLLVATMLFNANFVLPWYLNAAPSTTGVELKLMHLNVLSTNSNYERVINAIDAEQPDVVFLQEVTDEWLLGTRELLKQYPFTYSEPRLGNFGIAVFSKIPFDSVRHVNSPPLDYPTIVATLTVGSDTLTLISSHPTIPLGKHLYYARNEQMESLAGLVMGTTGPVVLLGDFNASIWCARYRELEASTGLHNVRRGFGILPTWPIFMPFARIPIDHILVSDGIGVKDARVGKRVGSDHLPLIATITL